LTQPIVLDIAGGTATLSGITLTPATANIPENTTQAYVSQGTYAGGTGAGTYDVSAFAPLTSTNMTVAGFVGLPSDLTKPSLVQSTTTAGTTTITSTYYGVVSNVASLTVNTTKVLASIAIQADANSTSLCATAASPCAAASAVYLVGGYNLQLHAVGKYTDGTSAGDITSSVTWSLSTPVVTGATLSAAGLLTTGTVAGIQPVTASQGTVTSAAFNITFDAATVASVSITSAGNTTSVANGAGATYEAVAATSAGTYWVTDNFTWASSNTAVGTIVATGAGAGQFTAVATSGSTNITATRGTLTGGPLVVTDTAATATKVDCSPATLTVQPGSIGQLTATVTFSDGSVVNETNSTSTRWGLSTGTVGSVSTTAGSRGQFTAINTAGSTVITAIYPGATAGATCTITVP
jgi:hypothetical protein